MNVQPINSTTTLLYLTFTQLQERGLHPDLMTHAQALRLAGEGLSSLGRRAEEVLELESYPDKTGLLLFIHTQPTSPAVWRFFDSDALLDAVTALPDLAARPMYRWKDAFWLVGESDAALSEFADRIDHDPLLSARLAEYALPLS